MSRTVEQGRPEGQYLDGTMDSGTRRQRRVLTELTWRLLRRITRQVDARFKGVGMRSQGKKSGSTMVETTKTGVRTVKVQKILDSPAGRDGLKKTTALFKRVQHKEKPKTADEVHARP